MVDAFSKIRKREEEERTTNAFVDCDHVTE